MSELKIDKDVPIPASDPGGRPEKYPWQKMEVGDSFLIPLESMKHKSAINLAYQAGQRTGRKFSGRRIEGGTRVWRIA